MTLDRIELRGLRVFARHGVLDEERRDGQEFVIDAVLWLDTRPAAASDDLSKTIDYGALANRLVAVGRGPASPADRDAGRAPRGRMPVRSPGSGG